MPTSSVDITPTFFGDTLLDTAVTSRNNISSQNGIELLAAWDFSSLGVSQVNVFQTATAFGIFVNGTESSDGADRTTAGNFGLLNGVADNAVGFAPAAAVPEPETYAMMAGWSWFDGFCS